MKQITEKKIIQSMEKVNPNWSHDIKYIDGKFVEERVQEYQENNSEELLLKIMDNYMIFRNQWVYDFAPYCDNDEDSAEATFKEVIWRSAKRFNPEKVRKPKGKAFNAYLVSALCNQLKNHNSAQRSQKNHPRVICPICGEKVYQIDAKHLKHVIDIDIYKKMYPKYPLVSLDGRVSCPISGDAVDKITEPYLNRVNGSYTVEDFKKEFDYLLPKFPVICPVTSLPLKSISANYPSQIKAGYTEKEFVDDFEDFAGLITCPFTGKKMIEMTQRHLDRVLGQKHNRGRYWMAKFKQKYPNATIKAKQVPVLNPFTNEMVPEITAEMLTKAGTTIQEYLEDQAAIRLNEWYPDLVVNPFTGDPTKRITRGNLSELNKNSFDFYLAVCKNPMFKWQVQCAFCGEFVDNIWDHLAAAQHTYVKSMTLEEFEKLYGVGSTRIVVSTNSFLYNDAGDTVHIADLLTQRVFKDYDPMELEDSLYQVAEDELDRKIAKSMRAFETLEDICYKSTERREITLPTAVQSGKSRLARDMAKKILGIDDFDFTETPEVGSRKVEVMIPGRDTIRMRLMRLLEYSDLEFGPLKKS